MTRFRKGYRAYLRRLHSSEFTTDYVTTHSQRQGVSAGQQWCVPIRTLTNYGFPSPTLFPGLWPGTFQTLVSV